MAKQQRKNDKEDKKVSGMLTDVVQGRMFLTFDFFKRNWIYVVAVTLMMLMYISNKFVCLRSRAQIESLKEDLNNAKTFCVDMSARYNSRIRETQMQALIDTMHIDLEAPDKPPLKLNE